MFGYDWPQAHAAINDLPPALWLVSVTFDVAGTVLKRDSLKTVAFWNLVVGVVGAIAAVIAGLEAASVVQHSDEAHAIMERHELMALITTSLFAVLAVWRVFRRGRWRRGEAPFALAGSIVGLGLLIYTAQLGGALVFDHALGVPTARLEVISHERESEHHHHDGADGHDEDRGHMVPDSMRPHGDTTQR